MGTRNTRKIMYEGLVYDVLNANTMYTPDGKEHFKTQDGKTLTFIAKKVRNISIDRQQQLRKYGYIKPWTKRVIDKAGKRLKDDNLPIREQKKVEPLKPFYVHRFAPAQHDNYRRQITQKERATLLDMLEHGKHKSDIAKALGKRIEVVEQILAPH